MAAPPRNAIRNKETRKSIILAQNRSGRPTSIITYKYPKVFPELSEINHVLMRWITKNGNFKFFSEFLIISLALCVLIGGLQVLEVVDLFISYVSINYEMSF